MKQLYLIILAIFSCLGNMQAQRYFTLKDCLETGLENNYSVLISRNDEKVSKNNATLANAGLLPTLDATAGYSGSLDNTETVARESGAKTKDTGVYDQIWNVGLSLNWTIFDGFNMTTNYKRLKELEKQGETNTRITIEDFIASLTAEYYNYVQQKIRLKNFRYAVSLSKERLRIVEARYSIGSFSRLDFLQARVDFNADSSSYMKQQELLNTSRIRLNELMAQDDVGQDIIIPDSIIDVNTLLNFDRLWYSTLNTNASLLKAEQNRTLAELDKKMVNSRNYPYLRLNSSYGYTVNKYEVATTKRRNQLGLNVGLTVGFNIFDGNRSRERKNAQIAIENAKLRRDEFEQSLRADFSNLWQSYLNNIEVLKLEQDNLTAARENHEVAMERYMLGDLSGVEMREAQKSLLDAEERILSAEYDTKLCEISLLQISGRATSYLE